MPPARAARALLPASLALALLTGAGDPDLKECAAIGDASARLACYDALRERAPPDAAAPKAPEPAPEPKWVDPYDVDTFGMPQTRRESITARIIGRFTQWERGTLIRLDNGQVWKCVDEKFSIYPRVPENPEVEITRGMRGYTLEIKAIGRRLWVRRVS